MREALGEQLARYEAVCLGGENDGAWDPTMEDMITLSESFHLCVAVPRKWAPEVRHKCSWAHFEGSILQAWSAPCHAHGPNCEATGRG